MDEQNKLGPEDDIYTIGERCCCGDDCGVIRFSGVVEGSSGMWVGIEWNNIGRGKHNGNLNGKQYFICEKEGNCASFVRPKKVKLCYSVAQGLLSRYTNTDPTGYQEEREKLILGKKGAAVKVELVGMESAFEERSKLDELSMVSLIDMNISSAGAPGEIGQLIPNVNRLELSSNHLLKDWETISLITAQLTALKALDVSDTNLVLPTNPLLLAPRLSHLTELYLCAAGLIWKQVCDISLMVPSLMELHLCTNGISSLTPALKCWESLEVLNLEDNRLSEWEQIFHLRNYPKLHSLILNNNQLMDISDPPLGVAGDIDFPVLSSLSLKENLIHNWCSIDFFNFFFHLSDLRIKNNPLLYSVSPQQGRQFVIARIAMLTSLNNSPISSSERSDAERYYLSAFSSSWAEACDENGCIPKSHVFTKDHPRYLNLVQEMGAPVDLKSDLSKTNRFFDVTIMAPNMKELKELKKKLPMSLSIQKLKGVLHRLYKLDPSDQLLSYVQQHGSEQKQEIEMDDDLRPLSYYGMQSGNTILVRRK